MGKHNRKSSQSSDSSSSHKSHRRHKKHNKERSHSRGDSRESDPIMYPNMPYPGMPPMMMRPGGYYNMRFPRPMQYYPPYYQGSQPPPYQYWPQPMNSNPEAKPEEKVKEAKLIKLKVQTTLPFNEENIKSMVKVEFDSEWIKKDASTCE